MGGSLRVRALLAMAVVVSTVGAAPAMADHGGGFWSFDQAAPAGEYLELPTGLVVDTAEPSDVRGTPRMGDPADFVRVDVYGEGETSPQTGNEEACPRTFCVGALVRLVRSYQLELAMTWTDTCHDQAHLVTLGFGGEPHVTYLQGVARWDACEPVGVSAELTARDNVLGETGEPLRTSFTTSDTLE